MLKELSNILRGYHVWRRLRRKYEIDKKTVVLVLPEENMEWNRSAIKYLPDYMERRKSKKAIALVTKENESRISQLDCKYQIYKTVINRGNMKRLMDYYCLHRFFDAIVFFFLDYPMDNRSQFVLDNTDVTSDELVALSLYKLRKIPDHV